MASQMHQSETLCIIKTFPLIILIVSNGLERISWLQMEWFPALINLIKIMWYSFRG